MKNIWQTLIASNFIRRLRKLHQEEDGAMEMKMIMFLAIAALLAVILLKFGKKMFAFIETKWGEISGG